MEKRSIQMTANDNVSTVLCDIQAGDEVLVYDDEQHLRFTLTAQENIPYGNKIALRDMAEGEKIIKYGEAAGITCRSIPKGALVHVHNVHSLYLNIPETIIEEIIQEMHIHTEEKQ